MFYYKVGANGDAPLRPAYAAVRHGMATQTGNAAHGTYEQRSLVKKIEKGIGALSHSSLW